MSSPAGKPATMAQKAKRKISLPWFRQSSVTPPHPTLARQHTIDTPSSFHARLLRLQPSLSQVTRPQVPPAPGSSPPLGLPKRPTPAPPSYGRAGLSSGRGYQNRLPLPQLHKLKLPRAPRYSSHPRNNSLCETPARFLFRSRPDLREELANTTCCERMKWLKEDERRLVDGK